MQYDFHKIEKEVKEYWEKNKIPERIADFNANLKTRKKKFYLLDGPPYANAPPHAGHAMTIVFKDLWGKFKFMNGYAVWFQPGFDCHGLPIENMVEKKFGIGSKKDIENKIGVAKFIQMCKEYATQNLKEWMEYYKDLGAWKGWLTPYLTYEPYYIESIWWTVKKLFDEGLMVKGKKPIHWCPRCQTSISGYEATDSYKNVTDPSIYVKFKVKDRDNEYLLAWTTTPWTLPANVALVVHPDETYVKIEVDGEYLILAEKRLKDVMERAGIKDYKVIEKFEGKKLDGVEYEPLMPELQTQQEAAKSGKAHRIVMSVPILKKVVASKIKAKKEVEEEEEGEAFGHMVTMDAGTGIVHCAPGHGAEDNKLGAYYGLPVISPVDDEGKFTSEAGWLEGKFVKDADKEIIEHLKQKGLLFHAERIVHSYPLCWRCKTPLIYRTTDQWFFLIDPIKEMMLKFNEETRWLPDFAKERMRNWVKDEADWCISTQRYWGAPIPIWECKNCGHMIAVGSKKELEEKMVNDVKLDDLHKHVVDKVVLKCEKCGGEMKRIPDIINIWVESGVAPWASLGYPYYDGGLLKKLWRVDLVDESQDQIRGWFHAMLFMSAATFKERPYNTVCMNGWVLDEKGEKMSKSLGNVISAEEAFEQLGADVLRLYVCYSTAPWETHKFSMKEAKELFRFMNIMVNLVNFVDMYGVDINVDGGMPNLTRVEDRWLLSRLNSIIRKVESHIENFHFHAAARELVEFGMEDFSRLYLKLVKERYDKNEEREAMDHVISKTIFDVVRMLAPFCPYISEYIYLKLFKDAVKEDSVHMLEWPVANEKLIDEKLEREMELVMKIVEELNSIRQSKGIRLRWPLEEVVLSSNEITARIGDDIKEVIKTLANVKKVVVKDVELSYALKPRYDVIGPKFGEKTREVVALLQKQRPEELLNRLEEEGAVMVGEFEITKEMVDVDVKLENVPAGYEGGVVDGTAVLLKVEIAPELKEEGIAREFIRRVQLARKELGLRFEDEAKLLVDGMSPFINKWKDLIEEETNTKIVVSELKEESAEKFEFEEVKLIFRVEK